MRRSTRPGFGFGLTGPSPSKPGASPLTDLFGASPVLTAPFGLAPACLRPGRFPGHRRWRYTRGRRAPARQEAPIALCHEEEGLPLPGCSLEEHQSGGQAAALF